MGLRLYQAPVESDVQTKFKTDDRSARSRSSIRRALDRNEDRIRERRRRMLATAAAYNSFDARRGQSSADLGPAPPATTDSTGTRSGSEHSRRMLRDANRRRGLFGDGTVTIFGEPWAHLHAEGGPGSLRDESHVLFPALSMAVESDFLPPRTQSRPEPTYALSNMRSTQASGHSSRSTSRHQSRPLWSRMHRHSARLDGLRDDMVMGRASPWAVDADGLGDRNRSLSPEGDPDWGPLLNTLTPDPQPPSVGSSFASASAASASAATTQRTAATASSRTSFTMPDTAENSSFEHPCESGCDNSDTEGDEEDDMDQMPPISGLTAIRRSSVLRGDNDDPVELLGGIGGMQRIVRNLARREDIPDEWWADAGLSRTLSREASRD
ncbi:hypothetical protein VTI28DRAFT_10115 [Corynascus sepedonium]